MGHADIETTMNIYAEATKEKKKESFSNLEGKSRSLEEDFNGKADRPYRPHI